MKKSLGTDGIITFTFEGLESVKFDAGKCSERVQDMAMQHGFLQRIGDNAAISRKQKDGSVLNVTEEMRRNAILELVTHYESGTEEWNLKRAAGSGENQTIRAIAEKRGISYQEAEAFLADEFLKEME